MRTKPSHVDFEQIGYEAMMQSQDEALAKRRCKEEILHLAAGVKSVVLDVGARMDTAKSQASALWSQIYDRPVPVSDRAMLVRKITATTLKVLSALALNASVVGNVVTFAFFGYGLLVSIIVGLAVAALVVVAGHQAFEQVFVRDARITATIVLFAFVLCFWGVFQFAQARGKMADAAARTTAVQSYVDDAAAPATPSAQENEGTTEESVRQLIGSAMLKVMLAAEFMLGILLGKLSRLTADEDYVAWVELKRLLKKVARCEKQRNALLAPLEMAERRSEIGIWRAKADLARRPRTFYHSLPMLAVACVFLSAAPAFSQSSARQEAILIDISSSIGQGKANSQLFNDYLRAAKQLLATEPPDSRVWVSVIAVDSFGGTRELMKGWTPPAQGVFTDNLNRARRQLAVTFEAKSSGLAPTANGTDIFGALWHAKAIMESTAGPQSRAKEIWIFSDMINETATFSISALAGLGPERMLERAQAGGLVVPLRGYRVHVVGASTEGLDVSAWTTTKAFWTAYFRSSGAELASYATETAVER